jgi:CO/xanthine dehydrogenase FAD-binding subunit
MKAAPFSYIRANSLEHALSDLESHSNDAKVISGGQSLVPMMAMRLARPARLIDIHRLSELQQIQASDSMLSIGAACRQRVLERDPLVVRLLPLVIKGLGWVGHSQTKNRGTMGGSLVHADPSAEQPLCAVILGATMVLRSKDGGLRHLHANEFFLGPMFTAIRETEILVGVKWPVWTGKNIGTAFDELSVRAGDFAIASAAAQIQMSSEGLCTRIALGAGGVDGVPLSFSEIAQRLTGERPTVDLIAEIANEAVKACQPGSDLHASADYRRKMAGVLIKRVLTTAIENARQG